MARSINTAAERRGAPRENSQVMGTMIVPSIHPERPPSREDRRPCAARLRPAMFVTILSSLLKLVPVLSDS